MDEVNSGRKDAKRSSNGELAMRVNEVARLIMNGRTRGDILHNTSNWGVSDRQVDEYIARACKTISEINRESLQDNLAIIKRNYWQLYRQALKEKDGRLAANILESLAKLMGLYK